jgi:hypothetical protein
MSGMDWAKPPTTLIEASRPSTRPADTPSKTRSPR